MMTCDCQLSLPFMDSDSDIFRALKDVNALVQYRDMKVDPGSERSRAAECHIDSRQCEFEWQGSKE